MEPLDPLKGKPLSGVPLTEEWLLQQKKLLKEGKIETPPPHAMEQSKDVYTPSKEAEGILKTKYEVFLESVRSQILGLDKNSEDFLKNATKKMVSTAFEQEFGEKILKDSGFAQMQDIITRKILKHPEHKEIVERFLHLLEENSK